MMKKKLSISLLTILFLVSTTGLPVWSHYCEMIGKKSISECETCIVETQTSCCSEETLNDQLKFTSENSSCCFDEFDYKKIEDDFSFTFTPNLINLVLASVTIDDVTFESEQEKHSHQNKFDLPPPKFGKQLLNSIHQLKLDIPAC